MILIFDSLSSDKFAPSSECYRACCDPFSDMASVAFKLSADMINKDSNLPA